MSGFRVASDMEGVKHWLKLTATYTREEHPVDVEEVATRGKAVG